MVLTVEVTSQLQEAKGSCKARKSHTTNHSFKKSDHRILLLMFHCIFPHPISGKTFQKLVNAKRI